MDGWKNNYKTGEFVMTIQIIDLVRRFDSGEIQLPMMQREYVWKPAKVVKLLDSLYNRWPIGCFYVWHTTEEQNTKERVGGKIIHYSIDGFYGFLLDGQQRLTSLSLAISGEVAENADNRAFFDVEKNRFFLHGSNKTIQKRVDALDPGLVPLFDLMINPNDTQAVIQRIIDSLYEWERIETKADETNYRTRLHSAATMLNQTALCQEFHNDHVADAIELFARLNKGGTSLSSGEVEAARLSQAATAHIVKPMRSFVQNKKLSALGFNFSFLTRTLVTIHRGSSGFANLPRNWATGDIDTSWESTQKGLQYAASLVRDEFGWTSRRWLPSANALIPIAYLFKDHSKAPSKKERESAKSYLLLTGLRGLFRGSVETSINTFVNPLKTAHANIKNRGGLLVKRIPQNRLFKIKPNDIINTVGMYSPLMQIYLAYLVSKKAKSWPSGRLISEIALGKISGDILAVHHIFPKKYMTSLGYPPEDFNVMANYAVLLQSDNAELGDEPPAEIYSSLSSQERSMTSTQLFLRGQDDLLNPENYDEFVEHRSKLLADALNTFLGL
ncbi:conserved hypothetical protein [Candidatus Denitrolinea symbiosum]|nr:conserved hypothetical protein [Candidatus Denitrolinea symbiosum]